MKELQRYRLNTFLSKDKHGNLLLYEDLEEFPEIILQHLLNALGWDMSQEEYDKTIESLSRLILGDE